MVMKLEAYAIALAFVLVAVVGAYYKGGADKERKISMEEAAQLTKAMEDAAIAARNRADADNAAREVSQMFVDRVDTGLKDIGKRFAHVPQVIVDTRGCANLSPSFRLRWNAAESLLPTGRQGSVDPAIAVQADGLSTK